MEISVIMSVILVGYVISDKSVRFKVLPYFLIRENLGQSGSIIIGRGFTPNGDSLFVNSTLFFYNISVIFSPFISR